MHSTVREIKEEEYALLENFLYEAIFVPEGTPAPVNLALDQAAPVPSVPRLRSPRPNPAGVAPHAGPRMYGL